ncbi:MAG TPA: SRPBCC family protein [Gaiellaceae bacterium]
MAEENENENAEQNGGGSADTVKSALKSKELLLPAALSALGAVAVSKGPDLFRQLTSSTQEKGDEEAERLGEKAAQGAKSGLTGGGGGMLGKVAGKMLPGGGGGGGGGKKTRRLPIQRWTDVAVPVDFAYREWTNFNDFPKFMHRVLTVEPGEGNDDKVRWQEKIWFSKRDWEGKITERRKNDRIAWKTTSGTQHHGVVTFHRIDDNLTRVMVDMEFEPTGMFEKMASGLRFVKRAVQADLARFKAHCEMKDAKGIDYRPTRGEDDEEKEDEKDDDKGRNGNGRSRNEKDDADRDEERREREQRREERRQTAGAAS